MEKKIKQILWIAGIILALLILNSYQKSQEQEIGLKIHYYKDGVEVFSIITPPGGSYDAIQFEIIATNTGNLNLTNMQIIDATPLAFKNALPTTTKTLLKGETKTLWISNTMNTSQFESMTQPVIFWIKVSGVEGYTQTLKYAEFSLDLKIEAMGECKTIPTAGTPWAIVNIYNDSYGCKHWSFKTYCPISPLPEGTTTTTATISASRTCTGYWMSACSPCGEASFAGNCWYDAYCEGGGQRCDTAYCTQSTYSIPDYGGLA